VTEQYSSFVSVCIA